MRLCRDASGTAAVAEKYKWPLYHELRGRFSSPVAKLLTLKILNVCLARHAFLSRATRLVARPIGLVVDPSNVCLLGCPGCVHSASNLAGELFVWPNGTIAEDRLSALLQRFGPYAVGTNFYNYGEPLLNLKTPKYIRQAKRYLMRTALSTSLSVQRFDPEAYVESGLDCMILSIDGATQRVYQRFRRNGDLGLVLDNLRRLTEERRKLRRRTPFLIWNFLGFEHNIDEMPAARRLARKLGVDQFRLAKPFDVTWDDPEIRAAAVEARVWRLNWAPRFLGRGPAVPEDVEADAAGWAFAKPFAAEAPAQDEEATAGHTCHWLYKNMVMDANGRILPCCAPPLRGTEFVFGSYEGDGGDPFNTPMHRAARAYFSTGARAETGAPYCTGCEYNQTEVNIGGREIRQFFQGTDRVLFNRQVLALLSGW